MATTSPDCLCGKGYHDGYHVQYCTCIREQMVSENTCMAKKSYMYKKRIIFIFYRTHIPMSYICLYVQNTCPDQLHLYILLFFTGHIS